MITILSTVVAILAFRLRRRASLELELIALRHQVSVLRRQHPGRLRLFSTDRLLWVWLYRVWPQVLTPTWRSLLHNHLTDIVAIDMFVVTTTTFRLLYTLIVLVHDRRRIIHFDVTQNPTQVWLSRQITEAFPWDTAPRYLLRDRDASYGQVFRNRLQAMGIKEVVTAARSPWQNAYVERIIGSVRPECLDHVIIFGERHLRPVLSSYFQYYHKTRTHLALAKDCPESRPVHPINAGKIIAFPQVGGLHHRYERCAA